MRKCRNSYKSTRPGRRAPLLALAMAGFCLLAAPVAGQQKQATQQTGTKYEGSDGFAVVRLKNLEKAGVVFTNWVGTVEVAGYNGVESCDEECYTPTIEVVPFELADDDELLVNFLRANQGNVMFVRYDLPTFGDEWQIVDARPWIKTPPPGLPSVLRVKPSGARRNFSLYGRVLRLQREGTFGNIWEGLYMEKDGRRVHPVSITSDEVALFLEKAMASQEYYYMGISVAFFSGFRNSAHDIFEINYKQQATLP